VSDHDQPTGADLSPIAVDAEIAASATVFHDGDPETRTSFAAAWVADALRTVLAQREQAVLALVGGQSVRGVHAALADHDLDWSRVVVTQGDERAVPADSDERNWRVIEPLVDPLLAAGRLDPDHVLPLGDLPPDADEADVQAALEPLRARVDRVDVALLAAGPDGHCASLFPGHPALASTGTFTVVTDSPKPPPTRVSMTVPMLAGASASLLVCWGEAKAEAAAAITTDGPLSEAPARIVHLAPRAVIVTG
jgi:6-phosphogluconolactonase